MTASVNGSKAYLHIVPTGELSTDFLSLLQVFGARSTARTNDINGKIKKGYE